MTTPNYAATADGGPGVALYIPDGDQLRKRVAAFRTEVRDAEPELVVQKHVLHGGCVVLDDEQYFDLKRTVSSHFEVNPAEVVVVGSAKLGFSLLRKEDPSTQTKKRYRLFCDESDVDIAIISDALFDAIWRMIFDYMRQYGDWGLKGKFATYLLTGWIRPDKMPLSPEFTYSDEWFEFFRELANSDAYGGIRLRAGLYRSWYHLQSYQLRCVNECRSHERKEV